MKLWCYPHLLAAKAQASLRISAGSSEPSLLACTKYRIRVKLSPKIRHLGPLDSFTCMFKEYLSACVISTIILWAGPMYSFTGL